MRVRPATRVELEVRRTIGRESFVSLRRGNIHAALSWTLSFSQVNVCSRSQRSDGARLQSEETEIPWLEVRRAAAANTQQSLFLRTIWSLRLPAARFGASCFLRGILGARFPSKTPSVGGFSQCFIQLASPSSVSRKIHLQSREIYAFVE